MPESIVVIDIETENTGYDIMDDNKRIISIQFNDGTNQALYFVDSPTNNLQQARARINTMISSGVQFVGYNVRNFDIPLLKKFEDIVIPRSQVTEIGEMKNMIALKNRLGRYALSLVEACGNYNVECGHKDLLKPISDRISRMPEVIERARIGAMNMAKKYPKWTPDYCRNRALDKISGGMAILETYTDFIRLNGVTDSIFYKYAIGDVISEYLLYQKVNAP